MFAVGLQPPQYANGDKASSGISGFVIRWPLDDRVGGLSPDRTWRGPVHGRALSEMVLGRPPEPHLRNGSADRSDGRLA